MALPVEERRQTSERRAMDRRISSCFDCGKPHDPGPKGYKVPYCHSCQDRRADQLEKHAMKLTEQLTAAHRTLHEMYKLQPDGVMGQKIVTAKSNSHALLKFVRDYFPLWQDPAV